MPALLTIGCVLALYGVLGWFMVQETISPYAAGILAAAVTPPPHGVD